MGQAKRHGTREQRIQQAIEARSVVLKTTSAPKDKVFVGHPTRGKQSTMGSMLVLAALASLGGHKSKF